MTEKSEGKPKRLSVKKQAVKPGGGGGKGRREPAIFRQEPGGGGGKGRKEPAIFRHEPRKRPSKGA